jgi:cardiolipin synthase
MTEVPLRKSELIDDPLKLFNLMLNDIRNAQKYVYLETYKYGNDPIGMKFRDELTKKAKQGVEVKVMIDSWGAYVNRNFFAEMIKYGGELRIFKKINISINFFTRSHRRNHRKLLIIDDEIFYIGSANINNYSIVWREAVLRMENQMAMIFKKLFIDNYAIYNKYFYDKIIMSKVIKYKEYEIIRDVPTTVLQPSKKKYVELIREAKEEIIIETPYFLPGSYVRKAMIEASKRGVKIKVITPKHSDVGIVDTLRSRYLGELHKNGIEFIFYVPYNLHAKVFMVDKQSFIVGTSNFDYRSFRFQHEINLFGSNKSIISQIIDHINITIADSIPFDYEHWLRRSFIEKFFEWFFVPFRHFF